MVRTVQIGQKKTFFKLVIFSGGQNGLNLSEETVFKFVIFSCGQNGPNWSEETVFKFGII